MHASSKGSGETVLSESLLFADAISNIISRTGQFKLRDLDPPALCLVDFF